MRAAEKAWLTLGAGIAAYEIAAPKGELLSEGVDRAIEAHPIATRIAIGVTALHLANLLPHSIDPYHQVSRGINYLRERRHGA